MSNETVSNLSELKRDTNVVLIGSSGWLIIITILLIRFRSKLWKLKNSRCFMPAKYFWKILQKLWNFLDDCCTLMVDDIDVIYPTIKFREKHQETKRALEHWFTTDKPKQNIGVEPITRKIEGVKKETPKEEEHPWDIAQEIIKEQNRAALSIKWSAVPLETLMNSF